MRVGLLHFSGPPVVGGVESTLAQQARFLASGMTPLPHRRDGGVFDPRVDVRLVPAVGSREPEVLAVKAELDGGAAGPRFDTLRAELSRQTASDDRRPAGAGGPQCPQPPQEFGPHRRLVGFVAGPRLAPAYRLAPRPGLGPAGLSGGASSRRTLGFAPPRLARRGASRRLGILRQRWSALTGLPASSHPRRAAGCGPGRLRPLGPAPSACTRPSPSRGRISCCCSPAV